MSGSMNVGGLISGLDTNQIIQQLLQLERQPLIRVEQRISTLETQKEAIRNLRTELTTLSNRSQDFRFGGIFSQFEAASSKEAVLGAEVSGASPVVGSYQVDVTQLASSTVANSSAVLGAAIDPGVALDNSGINSDINAGTFSINGVSFNVDPATDSLNGILTDINNSGAGVTATYDAATDKVTFANDTPGDTSIIIFGGADDTSNFLNALNITEATQTTNANGATEATSTRNLGAVDPAVALDQVDFAGGAVTGGSFKINGVTIDVDPTTDALGDVLARINDSDAQVTATYDTATDTIRVISNALGSRTISFESGTSNFLEVTNLTTADQTAGKDARFSINGGPVQTRNTNEVSDAIGGVTLRLLDEGTSTVTVSADDEAVADDIDEFVSAFNSAVDTINTMVSPDGALAGDSSMRVIDNYLRGAIFDRIEGLGDYQSLVDVGITTGDGFDAGAVAHIELDRDTFLEALRDDRVNVKDLFSNSDGTGIADQLFDYLSEITATTGFLNARAKANGSIDVQIRGLNDRIDQLEQRIDRKEEMLRRQFTQLEQLVAGYQSQGSALNALSGNFQTF